MLISSASVVGHEEAAGPLGDTFDMADTVDDRFGMDTWEQSESEMQRLSLGCAMSKCTLTEKDIGAVYAGDLLNQCVGSNYGLLRYRIPYLGLYGACSTAAEGILLGTIMCSAASGRTAAVTSSHYCSAERQFRYPLEYGGQRAPTAQWTVTGSGAFIISSVPSDAERSEQPNTPCITELLPGYAVDRGIRDVNNMGAAMAPAAADTLCRYFSSGRAPTEFDMIITGDLGREGSAILDDIMASHGFDISSRHVDCGILIYDIDSTDKHSGGSGCGCSAAVLASYVLDKMRSGIINDILFIGTGALMSPLVLNQGSSIPGIAHLVRIRNIKQ